LPSFEIFILPINNMHNQTDLNFHKSFKQIESSFHKWNFGMRVEEDLINIAVTGEYVGIWGVIEEVETLGKHLVEVLQAGAK
jgi:hypothetical protein